MSKKFFAIGLVLATIAVLGVPMTAFADTTDITGTLGSTATLTVPTAVSLTTLTMGPNTGSAGTPGSVVATATGWTLTVADGKTNNNGKMTVNGSDNGTDIFLTNPIQVGMTAGTVTTIASYQGQLGVAGGYGGVGTFSIPLYVSQTVVSGDKAGAYKITLIYTLTPPP